MNSTTAISTRVKPRLGRIMICARSGVLAHDHDAVVESAGVAAFGEAQVTVEIADAAGGVTFQI
jgi:hypothetical protein